VVLTTASQFAPLAAGAAAPCLPAEARAQSAIFFCSALALFETIGGLKAKQLLPLISLTRAAFALDPPPDGGNPKSTTEEGEDALFSLWKN
jgi:hypothetical protein